MSELRLNINEASRRWEFAGYVDECDIENLERHPNGDMIVNLFGRQKPSECLFALSLLFQALEELSALEPVTDD